MSDTSGGFETDGLKESLLGVSGAPAHTCENNLLQGKKLLLSNLFPPQFEKFACHFTKRLWVNLGPGFERS